MSKVQYQTFIDAQSYANPDFWREAIAHGRWQDGQVYRFFTDEEGNSGQAWFSVPYNYGEPFNLPNHPVVGVSWYEALAFTRWLEEYYGNAGILPAGLHVNLPNEPEWEKAGRGGLRLPAMAVIRPIAAVSATTLPALAQENPQPGRVYPWGDDPDPERANSKETAIGGTSAAGCFVFGASAYGVEELSGNVWEWTRTLWGKKYPYNLEDGREDLAAGDIVGRVLRGGSSYSDIGGVGCGVRDRNYLYWYLGFRVVLSPFTSGL